MNEQDQSTEYAGDRPLVDVARESSFALRDTTLWLHRRVERISHADRLMIRRKVSVDFTIPPELPPFHDENGSDGPSVYFVPVALLRKWPPLMDFDLRAQDGCPIPLLTSQKNREVDAAALVGLAPAGEERECLASRLEDVAKLDAAGAERALDVVGTILAAKLDSLTPEDQRGWARTLRVAGSLVRNSILWVRIEARAGERRLIKFAFIEQAPRELLLRRRILSAFSWAPRRAQYELPNLGERGSYHLEIEAPPDLDICSAKLRLSKLPPAHTVGARKQTSIGALLRTVWQQVVRALGERLRDLLGTIGEGEQAPPPHLSETEPGEPYAWNLRERAYLYVVGSQDQYGVASVDMAIGNRALISSSLRASIVITVLLGFLWRAPGSVVHHLDGAVALLVIFPALLALLVVRPGEHPMMRQLIAGVRLLLVTAAMLPVVDAVLMLGFAHPSAGDLRTPFLIVFLAGILVSLLLGLSRLLPPPGDGHQISAEGV
ncbi:MAG: hypothetical protein WBV85_01460 [Solirubrobacteraceae bacterium]